MATYEVTVIADGGYVIDHATTTDMGRAYGTDSELRELALSYAEVQAIQAVRQELVPSPVIVVKALHGPEILRKSAALLYAEWQASR